MKITNTFSYDENLSTYSTEEVVPAVSNAVSMIASIAEAAGQRLGKHLSKEERAALTLDGDKVLASFGDKFFQRLGIDNRKMIIDPNAPKLWWDENTGKDPFAS